MREAFNETTDLYLQLLRKAQEVEDPRLVGMILERLRQGAPHLVATDSGCVVIPFPIGATWSESPPNELCFWPRVAVSQVGYLLTLYAFLVIGHAFLG